MRPVIVSSGIVHALDASELMQQKGEVHKTSLFVDEQVVGRLQQLVADGYPLPVDRQLPEVHTVLTCSA